MERVYVNYFLSLSIKSASLVYNTLDQKNICRIRRIRCSMNIDTDFFLIEESSIDNWHYAFLRPNKQR